MGLPQGVIPVTKVSVHQGQYKTYRLIDTEAQAYLEVVPERGGIITRWYYRGRDLLYWDGDRFGNPSQSVRGGIPVLFPICGSLPNSTYYHHGIPYSLPRHGFARNLPWEVVETCPAGELAICLRLESSEATRPVYPFDFSLTLTYRLSHNQLAIASHLENRSPEPMPFSLGFHPYFPVPNKERLSLEIPATQLIDQLTHEHQPFFGQFDFKQAQIDVIFSDLAASRAALSDTLNGYRWLLDWSDSFSHLAFWTRQGQDYVCLAPGSGPRNAPNTGPSWMTLPPGSSHSAHLRLAIELGDRSDGLALAA